MKTLLSSGYLASGLYQPFKEGSLQHIQNAYTELFNIVGQAIQAMGTDTIYSTSVPYSMLPFVPVVSGGSYIIPATAIYYNGIWYLAPQTTLTYPITMGNAYIGTITTSYVTSSIADPITMSDGITTDYVHQIKTIVWSVAPIGSGDFAVTDVVGIQNLQVELDALNTLTATLSADITSINTSITNLTNATSQGTWITASLLYGWSSSGARFKKDGMGRVSIQAVMEINTTGDITGWTFFNLPVGYRPSRDLNIPAFCYDNATVTFISTSITISASTGAVILNHTASNISVGGSYVAFDGVTFDTL